MKLEMPTEWGGGGEGWVCVSKFPVVRFETWLHNKSCLNFVSKFDAEPLLQNMHV